MSYTGHLIVNTDISNWVGTETDAQQGAIIDRAEDVIEKVCQDKFYQDDLDIYLDGNSKNRIFVSEMSKIIEIDAVYISGVELDSTYYEHDDHSVYISNNATNLPELNHILKMNQCLFPEGTNNIRITGHIGTATAPPMVKRAAIILAEYELDNSLYTHYISGPESMGSYSVSHKRDVLTGILEADELLDHYVNRRAQLFA